MAEYKVTDAELTYLADKIRAKGGTEEPLEWPTGFGEAVDDMSSAVIQPLSATQNGTYNPPSGVDGYAPVTVNVSGGTQYNYLDEYNAGWSYSGDYASGSLYSAHRVMIVNASSATGTWYTTQPIDFTGKTKLRIVISELSGSYTEMCRLVISTRPINNRDRGDSWVEFDNHIGTYYLDLPAQKDALYVGAMAWTKSKFTVDEIVAE